MVVRATVIEMDRDGSNKRGKGDFDFTALPSAGSQIVLWGSGGGLDIMEAVAIEHSPVSANPDTMAAKMAAEEGPTVRVFVQFLRMEY